MTQPVVENSKKIAKKLRKLKNTIMTSFQAKISWERPRKKKIIPMSSYPTYNRKFQKNSKKIQKIKKHHYGFFSSQNRLEIAENERKKKIVPMSFYLTRNRKFKKNSKKIQKNKKHHYSFFSSQNRLGKACKG